VAREPDPPVGQLHARLRLGRVVQQRREAQPAPAGQLVGERLGQQRAHRLGQLGAEHGGRVALERDGLLEHLERVAVDVAVVVGVLPDPAQRGELGQHDAGQPELVHQLEAGERAVGGDDALQLGEHALGRAPPEAGRVVARRASGGRVDREAQVDREPREAQRAQRIGRERGLGHHAQAPGGHVGAPAVGVDQRPALERLGHGVDGQVACGEVALERAALQRGEVDLPGVSRADHAPAAERVRQLERSGAGGAGEAPRGGARVALDGQVEVLVARAPAEQPVAHRPADQPGGLILQRRAERVLDHPAGAPSRWCTRGTRRLIPHVIS
jgi:hypothetical protein